MQGFLTDMVYFSTMTNPEEHSSHLTLLREHAGLTVRELSRQLGTSHPNILSWEKNGRVAKSEFLLPLARILGVTVEEILGEAKPRRVANPGGKLGQAFDAAAKLPRSKQEKVIALLEAFVAQHEAKAS